MSFREIPDLSALRSVKDQYPTVPIDTHHILYNEEVVSVSMFGLKGQSYYSRPNKATGKPLPGVNAEPLLRYSVAARLEQANRDLRASKDIAKLLGGRVEFIIRDALRSRQLQLYLADVVFPEVLRKANPGWDAAKISEELPHFIARPSSDKSSPTPHMTGGAFDIDIVHLDGRPVNFGHETGTKKAITEFYETSFGNNDNPDAQIARRIVYWTMTDHGFINNPYEWWHHSYGDQMWALFSGEAAAMYGAIEHSPDLLVPRC